MIGDESGCFWEAEVNFNAVRVSVFETGAVLGQAGVL